MPPARGTRIHLISPAEAVALCMCNRRRAQTTTLRHCYFGKTISKEHRSLPASMSPTKCPRPHCVFCRRYIYSALLQANRYQTFGMPGNTLVPWETLRPDSI